MWTVEVYKTVNGFMCLVSLMKPQQLQAANGRQKGCWALPLHLKSLLCVQVVGKRGGDSCKNLLDLSPN